MRPLLRRKKQIEISKIALGLRCPEANFGGRRPAFAVQAALRRGASTRSGFWLLTGDKMRSTGDVKPRRIAVRARRLSSLPSAPKAPLYASRSEHIARRIYRSGADHGRRSRSQINDALAIRAVNFEYLFSTVHPVNVGSYEIGFNSLRAWSCGWEPGRNRATQCGGFLGENEGWTTPGTQ